MDRRDLQKKLLNLVKQVQSFHDVTETEFHDIEFYMGETLYGIYIPKDRKDAVKLYRIESVDFTVDKDLLETYQHINSINGDSGNVTVYLNDITRDIIFTFQLNTEKKSRFLKSLLKGLFELKDKVEFYMGGYIDELVEEPPCISCRHHKLENNISGCMIGNYPAFYIIKSNECPDHRGWSDNE
jgi:hypothetical protein